MKRGDKLLIAVLLLCALIFIIIKSFPSDVSEKMHNNRVAKITIDGKLFRTVELTAEAQEIEVKAPDGGSNLLKVHDYGIEMIDADCPDKVCLTFGFITNPNQTIVCLPHRMLVEIEDLNDEGDEVDAVVQ